MIYWLVVVTALGIGSARKEDVAMSWQSEKEEDATFNSLSGAERRRYFEEYRQNGGDVQRALDAVVGPVWFDRDGAPKGHRHRGPNDD